MVNRRAPKRSVGRPPTCRAADEGPVRRGRSRWIDQGDDLLDQVAQWDEDIRSYVHGLLEQVTKTETAYIPVDRLYRAEQTIEQLLDPRFREQYRLELEKSESLAKGRFMASDPEGGQHLVQELGVISVVPVPARQGGLDFLPVHKFPMPVWHYRSRTDRSQTVTPDNIRLLLDHVDFLRWHPVYLLVCTQCGWLQGALGTAESYASKRPYPREQVRSWWDASRSEFRDRDVESYFLIDRLTRDFSEEIWGFGVIQVAPPKWHDSHRWAVSGDVAKVLDRAMGFSGYPEDWPGPLRELSEANLTREMEALGSILRQLTCQVCAYRGASRYLPRLLLPVDADLSSSSQEEFTSYLVGLLDRARDLIAASTARQGILWMPAPIPRMRPSELAERLELRHEERRSGKDLEPNLWLLAMWLIGVGSASALERARKRIGPAKRKAGTSRITWPILLQELGVDPKRPARRERSHHDERGIAWEVHELARRIDALVANKAEHHRLVAPVRSLLLDQEFSHATEILASHYRGEILPSKLAELRRKPK